MNGFIKTTAAGLFGAASLAGLAGCHCYREHVDPCWPERYNAVSRQTVRDTFNAQAGNGHILDQTVWNHHFAQDPQSKAPTDRLNAAGLEHLKYLVRRQPQPDPKIYLQTAQDLPVDPKKPADAQTQRRTELDAKRTAAIQRFLNDYTSGRNQAVAFHVEVHDPADPSVPSTPYAGSNRMPPIRGVQEKLWNSYQGGLPMNQGGAGNAGGGGGAGGGN